MGFLNSILEKAIPNFRRDLETDRMLIPDRSTRTALYSIMAVGSVLALVGFSIWPPSTDNTPLLFILIGILALLMVLAFFVSCVATYIYMKEHPVK